MKYQWSQFPFVLRRKILLTFLAGIASIAVSLVIFTVTADRILLVLGGLIFAASLVLGSSLWRTAARGQYEVVEGICAGVSTPMLRRYRKIQLIDEQGAERTLLLSKTAKFQRRPLPLLFSKREPACRRKRLSGHRSLHQQFPWIRGIGGHSLL